MTQIPISSAMVCAKPLGFADPFSGSKGWVARFGDQPVSQFTGAQMIADKWGISRDDMEAFALESHRRARVAQKEGRFDRRSEEHTSELQSLMRISYAVFCLKKKQKKTDSTRRKQVKKIDASQN